MSSWRSYPKIVHLDKAIQMGVFDGDFLVEEKIDGSQFAFGKFNGELKVRSKGREFEVEAPDNIFAAACETVKALKEKLIEGYTYRGEVLSKPKHNVLKYGRVPSGNIILFDLVDPSGCYLSDGGKRAEANRVGLEHTMGFEPPKYPTEEWFGELLETTSSLGEVPIEGFVVKNYRKEGPFGGHLMGKYVSDRFKEAHKANSNMYGRPSNTHIIDQLIDVYRTEARWQKAVQHLRDDGRLDSSPRDIGPLIGEICKDVYEECGEEIKEFLFKRFWKDVARGLTRGFPDFYKHLLISDALSETPGCTNTAAQNASDSNTDIIVGDSEPDREPGHGLQEHTD